MGGVCVCRGRNGVGDIDGGRNGAGSKAIEKLLPCMKWNTRFKFWQLNCVPAAEAAPLLPDGAVAPQLPPCDDDARIRRRRRRELVRVGHLAADSEYKIGSGPKAG